MKKYEPVELMLDKIVGGGQALGTLADGRKLFAWGGLPGERVIAQPSKAKSSYVEAIVSEVLEPSTERIAPRDQNSFLSTSPWQIMSLEAEQRHKAELIAEAFTLHDLPAPENLTVYTDGEEYAYRNKVEFSWYGDTDAISGVDTLDLAFFRRGSKGKIIVEGTSLARPEINQLALAIRDLLRTKPISARNLKTLLIRTDQKGNCVWQLYIKDSIPDIISEAEAGHLPAQGGEVIYSNPKSPASVVTERLASFGDIVLTDTILGVPFRYATEGFFQVNIPVYERALKDMRQWVGDVNSSSEDSGRNTVIDLYSGVGSIGLTIGGPGVTLVEINEHAVREMKRNIEELGVDATPVLAASEQALQYITSDKIIIVDPPRAGLHADVISRLLETKPTRIIYLSCNPVTQARDIALLKETYATVHYQSYNFFPRTPHIEGLAILDRY